jgi:hypothetical protein
VLHWIQQQSVEPFPTHDTRQIEFAPWSAFVLVQFHLLLGSDQLDNLVQWFAMVMCVFVASHIAQQLLELSRRSERGGTELDLSGDRNLVIRRTAALSCLLVTTLPIGIVESITTQTDYVVTCWFIGLTCLLLALWREPANVWYALGAGLALALGVLTKATMLIYAAPLGVAFVILWMVGLRSNRLRVRLPLIFVCLVLAFNGPHWLRNAGVFGSPLGSRHILSIERNARISIGGTLSNLIRNLTLQTNTGIQPLTDVINRGLLRLHQLTGRKLNDPDTTYHLGAFSLPTSFSLYDSDASSFYHLALILICTVILLRRPKENAVHLSYCLPAVGGLLLFCAFLRWQQWHSRIHLAWFVFLAPWAAGVLATKLPEWFSRFVAVGLLFFAVFCLVNNRSCPLTPLKLDVFSRERRQLTLFGEPLYEPLALVARDIFLSGCQQVGLKTDFEDSPEYSFWIFLRNRGFTGQINHVWVENESARVPTTVSDPCLILSTSRRVPAEMTARFRYQSRYGPLKVFWSERASSWAELAQLTKRSQTARRLPAEAGHVVLEGQTITFGLRTLRAGHLHLSGLMKDAAGRPLRQGAVRISTQSGFEETLTLTGERFSLAVPSTGGMSEFQVEVSDLTNTSTVLWEQFNWSWQPQEAH